MSKKLNEEFGISDKDIDNLMKEADNERESLTSLSEDDLQKIQERKEKTEEVKKALKATRGMTNTPWAESIIKTSIENAVIAQHLAIADIEDDYQSKKVTSLSELTNAITSGASEVVKLEHQNRHLEIAQEKNDLRRMETSGNIIDANNTEKIEAVGKGKDLLKIIKAQVNEEDNEDNINKEVEDTSNEE